MKKFTLSFTSPPNIQIVTASQVGMGHQTIVKGSTARQTYLSKFSASPILGLTDWQINSLGHFFHGDWRAVQKGPTPIQKLTIGTTLAGSGSPAGNTQPSVIGFPKIPKILANLKSTGEIISISFNSYQTLHVSKVGLFFVDTKTNIAYQQLSMWDLIKKIDNFNISVFYFMRRLETHCMDIDNMTNGHHLYKLAEAGIIPPIWLLTTEFVLNEGYIKENDLTQTEKKIYNKVQDDLSKNFPVNKSDECNNPFYRCYQKIALVKYLTYVFSLMNQPLNPLKKKLKIENVGSRTVSPSKHYNIGSKYPEYDNKIIHVIAIIKEVVTGPVFFPDPIRNRMPFKFKWVFGIVEIKFDSLKNITSYALIPITGFLCDTPADEKFVKPVIANSRRYLTTPRNKRRNQIRNKKQQLLTKSLYLPLDNDKIKEANMVRQSIQYFDRNRLNTEIELNKLVYQQMTSKKDIKDIKRYVHFEEKITFKLTK